MRTVPYYCRIWLSDLDISRGGLPQIFPLHVTPILWFAWTITYDIPQRPPHNQSVSLSLPPKNFQVFGIPDQKRSSFFFLLRQKRSSDTRRHGCLEYWEYRRGMCRVAKWDMPHPLVLPQRYWNSHLGWWDCSCPTDCGLYTCNFLFLFRLNLYLM